VAAPPPVHRALGRRDVELRESLEHLTPVSGWTMACPPRWAAQP
jgi:hypothetical protein